MISALALSVVAAGGCSTSSSPNGGSPSASKSMDTSDQSQVLKTYFEAFATAKSSTMDPMLSSSVPDSPAYTYAAHQINAAVAQEGDNAAAGDSTVTVEDSVVTMVRKGLDADATEEQRKEVTTIYRDFEFGPDGLIRTWTADPGGVLTERIAAQSGSATSGKVTITVKTVYLTNDGSLGLTYDVTNKSSKKATVDLAGYINPDGRQVKVAATPYQMDPAPGSFSTGYASITAGKRGGKLIVQFDYQTKVKLIVS